MTAHEIFNLTRDRVSRAADIVRRIIGVPEGIKSPGNKVIACAM